MKPLEARMKLLSLSLIAVVAFAACAAPAPTAPPAPTPTVIVKTVEVPGPAPSPTVITKTVSDGRLEKLHGTAMDWCGSHSELMAAIVVGAIYGPADAGLRKGGLYNVKSLPDGYIDNVCVAAYLIYTAKDPMSFYGPAEAGS